MEEEEPRVRSPDGPNRVWSSQWRVMIRTCLLLTQQVQARLWREACEEADLAQELEESLADD